MEPKNETANKAKPKRKNKTKPFMLLRESVEAEKVNWGIIELPQEIKSTAAMDKYLETTESLPVGRYCIAQLCGERTKKIENVKKVTLT